MGRFAAAGRVSVSSANGLPRPQPDLFHAQDFGEQAREQGQPGCMLKGVAVHRRWSGSWWVVVAMSRPIPRDAPVEVARRGRVRSEHEPEDECECE